MAPEGTTPGSTAADGSAGPFAQEKGDGVAVTPSPQPGRAPLGLPWLGGMGDLYARLGGVRTARQRIAAQGIVYLLFVLTCVAFSIWAPDFATVATLQNIGRNAAPVVVISVGMTFVIITAEIDLSVASTVSLAGLLGAQVLSSQGVPW